MRNFRNSMLLSTAVAAFIVARAAPAQNSPTQGTAPSAADNSREAAPPAAETTASTLNGGIQEIVVTANKRAENLQKVAASVAAVNQEALTRQGVKEITDINKVVPEVTIQTGNFSNVTIRGIRTGSFGPTTDSPNAVHVDGAYLSRFTSLQGIFFDVQRVEVLQGPQGTLYGRNSAGGTINVITNKPSQELGGYANLEYGNYDAFNVTAAANLPLSNTLAIRGAFYHNSHRGYADNGTDDSSQDSGRFSLLWRPSTRDSLLFTADREQIRGRNIAAAVITKVLKSPNILISNGVTNCPVSGGVVPAACIVAVGTPGSAIVPIKTGSDERDPQTTVGSADLQRQRTNTTGFMGQYDHDLGWANLTTQVAYHTSVTHNPSGSTPNGFVQDPSLITTGVIRPTTPGQVVAHAHWDSQEIRMTSPSNQVLTYVAGLYRFHERSFDSHNYGYRVTYPNVFAAGAGTIGQVVYTSPLVINSDLDNTNSLDTAYAAFGQATYSPHFLEGAHLTLGGRYNTEKKDYRGFVIQNAAVVTGTQLQLSRRFNRFTYKANLSYDITDHNLIYIDHSTGFKSGGFGYGTTPGYEPENIYSYEIGMKNRFFDNRLQLNLSAWHYDYHNIVVNINEFFFDTILGRTNTNITDANGRRAKLDGQSVQLEARITRNDTFTLNATHNNARYTDFNLANRYGYALAGGLVPGATAAYFDYSHTPIGNVAKWSGNASFDHVFHVGSGQLDVQAYVQYTGKRLFGSQVSLENVNNYIIGSPYATADFSIRYKPDGSRWSLTGYVRNAFNKAVHVTDAYVSNANSLPTAATTFAYLTTVYGAPRTFGAILNVDF